MNDKEKIEFLLKLGSEWIRRSSLSNLDRTAYIFVTSLKEMGAMKEADELYKFYEEGN